MKLLVFISFYIIVFGSCSSASKTEPTLPTFKENTFGFSELRDGFDASDTWIREPENILMVHETLKKIGYNKLFSNEKLNNNFNWWIDVNKKPSDWIDSLILTYHSTTSKKYYNEFWQRRIKEGNAETVYKVLTEIQQILFKKPALSFHERIVNDTLYHLLSFEYPRRTITDKEANDHLEYLIQIGLHESAYNLISGENMAYQHINWSVNKDSIINSLSKSNYFIYPWFFDNSK